MDRKTLEYMEERAGKARALVNRIEYLRARAENLLTLKVDEVIFRTSLSQSITLNGNGLMKEITTRSIEEINDEIERLELELSEL